jgi:ribosomal protein S18 acetylase RimI-like enzyme
VGGGKVELRSIEESHFNTMISLVNEVFSDYPIPIRWNLKDFQLDIRENGISLKDSYILWENEEAIGFIIIGIREKTSRIDAMGLKARYRGTEASEYMYQHCLENLKWKKISSVQLEVLESEKRAIRFYEKRGFVAVRYLNAYRFGINPNLSPRFIYKPGGSKLIHELAMEAQQLFNRKLNWQRVPISLQNSRDRYHNTIVYHEKYGNRPIGFVVWGENPNNYYIVDCYRVTTDIELIDFVHDVLLKIHLDSAQQTGVISNLPEEDKLSEVFVHLGGEIMFRQLEMELKMRV